MSVEVFATCIVGSICSVFVAYQFLGKKDCFRLMNCFSNMCCLRPKNQKASSTIEISPQIFISSTRQRVILISDIGRDTDGPLALITLAKHPSIELAGVITTGGNTVNRCRVARYWLRMCGIKDHECFVVPDYSKVECLDDIRQKTLNNCQVPLSADTANNSALYRHSQDDAVALLLAEVSTWKEHVQIICLANTTTLADAFECNSTVMRQVGKIILPGTVAEPLKTFPIIDYNTSRILAEDYRSADYILEMCTTTTPNTKIHIIDENTGSNYRLKKIDVEHVCNYKATVRDCYRYIKNMDYDHFCKEHNILTHVHPSTWFQHIQYVCVPSKTLVVLAYIEPHLFKKETTQQSKYTVTKKRKYVEDIKQRLLECIEVKAVSLLH